MAGPFQEVAFNTPVGATSAPFKSTYVTITVFDTWLIDHASSVYYSFLICWAMLSWTNTPDILLLIYG